jgi:hypothetical protein
MYLESPNEWYDILFHDKHLRTQREFIVKTKIDDIAQVVLPSKGDAKLKYDIIKKGLTHPIIVIENTESNYKMAIRQITEDLIIPFDSKKPLLAYTGNQRLTIAKKWRYRYISALIMPDVHWAHAAQLLIQNGKVDNRDPRKYNI